MRLNKMIYLQDNLALLILFMIVINRLHSHVNPIPYTKILLSLGFEKKGKLT